jgi:hypothetical protein
VVVRSIGRRSRLVAALGAAVLILVTVLAPAAAAGSVVARLTFAANCANAEIPACEVEPFGIRYTVALQSDGTAVVDGSFSKRNPGSGTGGGDPIHVEIPYTVTTGPAGLTVGGDPDDRYYNIDLGNGTLSFPVTSGHFNAHFVSGVQIESTVFTY